MMAWLQRSVDNEEHYAQSVRCSAHLIIQVAYILQPDKVIDPIHTPQVMSPTVLLA